MIYTDVNVGKYIESGDENRQGKRLHPSQGCGLAEKNHRPNVIYSGRVRPRPHYTKTQPREKIESREIVEEIDGS